MAGALKRPGQLAQRFYPMHYSIECPCGNTLVVQAVQAGSTVNCPCGAQVSVPPLSRLREHAGQHAYETGTIDMIHGMLNRGELPALGRCALSGDPSADVIHLEVEAERVYSSSDGVWYFILGLVISPLFVLGMFKDPRPPVGRHTVVPTPLCVSAVRHGKVERARQPALKRWLRSVPIYARLLEQYPRARVSVVDSPDSISQAESSAPGEFRS